MPYQGIVSINPKLNFGQESEVSKYTTTTTSSNLGGGIGTNLTL